MEWREEGERFSSEGRTGVTRAGREGYGSEMLFGQKAPERPNLDLQIMPQSWDPDD